MNIIKSFFKKPTEHIVINNELYFHTKEGYYKVKADYVGLPKEVGNYKEISESKIPELLVIEDIKKEDLDLFLDKYKTNNNISYIAKESTLAHKKGLFNLEVFAYEEDMQAIKTMFNFNK